MRRQVLMVAAVAVCALAVCAGIAGARGVWFKNSGFERNSFQFWQTKQEHDTGRWVVYKGTPSLESFFTAPAPRGIPSDDLFGPRRGKYAAATVQGSPGTQLLFRSLNVKPDTKRKLAFVLSYQNYPGIFVNPDPDSLHASSLGRFDDSQRGNLPPGANQQYRVDIMRKGADPYSIDDADVAKNLLKSESGDPSESHWQRYRFNLNSLDPGKYELRVAAVASLSPLVLGFDALKLAQTK
jgi:hypothetical protein